MADASMKDSLIQRTRDFAEGLVDEDDKRIRACIKDVKPVIDNGCVIFRIPLDKFWDEKEAGMDWPTRARSLAYKNPGTSYYAETIEDVEDEELPFTLCLVVRTDLE